MPAPPAPSALSISKRGRTHFDDSVIVSSPSLSHNERGGKMKHFLAKTDPETYSIDDLEREEKTTWDGVTNAQAVRAIREMRPGDCVFIYHSGGVSGIVGLATVRSDPRADPNSPAAWRRPRRWPRSSSPANSTIGRWCARDGFRPWPRRRHSWPGCGRVIRTRRSEFNRI